MKPSSDFRPVGLHHISVMTRAPRPNYAFFTTGLGLRLAKKTVNQDDPGVYHLYYGDTVGSPGTGLTFFPWTHLAPGRPGWSEHASIGLRVPPGSLGFWADRIGGELGLAVEQADWFGSPELRFTAPDGTRLSLVEGTGEHTATEPWATPAIDAAQAYRGFHYVHALVQKPERTAQLLTEVLGFTLEGERGRTQRFRLGDGSDQFLTLTAATDEAMARPGSGSIHHVAFRVPDEATHAALREQLAARGVSVTPVIDRYYFKAMYFRDPNGLLFEIATDPPGFTIDEPRESLGQRLALPPFLEPRRAAIEAALPPLDPA